MKAVVWSKPACPYCTKAKNLLKNKGIEYEEKNIAEGHKIQDLLDLVPNAKNNASDMARRRTPRWLLRVRKEIEQFKIFLVIDELPMFKDRYQITLLRSRKTRY